MFSKFRKERFKFAERIRGRISVWLTKDLIKLRSRSELPLLYRLWILSSVLFNIKYMANTVIKLDLKDKDRFIGQNYDVWVYRLKIIF